MSRIGPVVAHLEADTRLMTAIAWSLFPLVWLGVLSAEKAIMFASRFLRVTVTLGK